MKKLISLILAFVMIASTLVFFSSCNGEKDDNKIYVGMECGYAPFNYTQADASNGAVKISNADGYANGYDVMIAKKIAEELGKELVIVKYEFDALINGVMTGALDFIIAGMSPTAKRKESIDFTDAYYESQLVLVVRKDGAYANATSLADFAGATLVAQMGTFHDTALNAQASAIGYTAATPMADFPAMINALKTKAIDGYVAEEPGAVADCAANDEFTYIKLQNNTTGFAAGAEDVQIAVGLKKGNSELVAQINAVLAKISAEERLNMMNQATNLSVGDNVQ